MYYWAMPMQEQSTHIYIFWHQTAHYLRETPKSIQATIHTSSNFARVTAVNGYSSEIPNHQGIFYVYPELLVTHGTPLGSV